MGILRWEILWRCQDTVYINWPSFWNPLESFSGGCWCSCFSCRNKKFLGYSKALTCTCWLSGCFPPKPEDISLPLLHWDVYFFSSGWFLNWFKEIWEKSVLTVVTITGSLVFFFKQPLKTSRGNTKQRGPYLLVTKDVYDHWRMCLVCTEMFTNDNNCSSYSKIYS